MVFEQAFEIRWADIDANFHLRHSVYADFCATVRLSALSHFGFGMRELAKLGVGPVLFKETLQYRKELRPDDQVKVNMKIGGSSADGRKWRICHEVIRVADGEVAATVEVVGAWMSAAHRKIVPPPEPLRQVFEAIAKTEDYQIV